MPVEDKTCKRCRMLMQPPIPHECDPSICAACNGSGVFWVGRRKMEWVGYEGCQPCEGTGRTVWAD